MKPNLHLLAPALLLVGLAGVGCTVKQALVGISPDRVDQIEIGTDRASVEDLVDEVESEMSCTSGAKVDYVYDRGNPPAPYPVLAGAFMLAWSAFQLGSPEAMWGACRIACQNGILEVIYDSDGKVVAATPRPRGYDAGFWCDRGKSRSFCDDVRAKARETDLARRLRASKDEVVATGCSGNLARFVETPKEAPKEPPAELKARADEGDVEAMYQYAFRINDRAESWKYRCLAANQNHPDAQGLVADHYRQGRDPVERDVLRAYVWYRLAELNGYEGRWTNKLIKTETGWKCCTAKPYSEVLADNMTPSELADGERLVSKWKPNPAECEREAKLAAD